MWSLLPRKIQLTLIIGTGIFIAWSYDALYALVTGTHPQLLAVISLTVTIVGSLLTAALQFSWRWVWRRWPFIQSKTFPDLNGTWKGTLASTWINPETNQPLDPIPTTVTIRQKLFRTDVSLKTGESESRSTRVFLEPDYDRRRFRLWYSYNNDPQAQHRHRSSPHEGVAFLDLDFDADQNRKLRIAAGGLGPAVWSSDGRTVLYLNFPTDPKQLNNLREATPDTNEDRLIAATSQFISFGGNADSSVLVGASGSKASPYVLLLVRAAKRELTLCEHRASDPHLVSPIFSANSQRIFFQSDKDGKLAIYSMLVDKLVEETEVEDK